jgi:hypothetical protein
MNVSGIPSTPTYAMASGITSTASSFFVCILETLSLNATQPMVSTQSMGINPFVFPRDMPNDSIHSMPWASNTFSFHMPNMTSHISSFVLTSNVNPSFGSGGTTPPYTPFLFGWGHIPKPSPIVGGWNPHFSRPNPIYNSQGWSAQMGGTSTSYILYVHPSSTMSVPMNDFLMETFPLTFVVPSGGVNSIV